MFSGQSEIKLGINNRKQHKNFYPQAFQYIMVKREHFQEIHKTQIHKKMKVQWLV